jgi:mono/diheme cytochrome c family protein
VEIMQMMIGGMAAFLTVLTVSGCGPDQVRVDAITALTPDLAAGATSYVAKCASCHQADGAGGDAGPAIKSESKADIIGIMLTGGLSMPAFDTLSDKEVADIAAHAESL